MENQDENERINFEIRWAKVMNDARTEASRSVEDLIVTNLQKKEGIGRISTRIKQVLADTNSLNRSIYFRYKNNPVTLFYYFKSNGILHDPKEWSNLQQAMKLDFQRSNLTALYKDNCNPQYMSPLEQMILNSDDMAYAGLRDNDRETLFLHRQNLLLPNDPAFMAVNPLEVQPIPGYLSKEKLLWVLNFLDEKYHLLAPQSPVDSLYRKIIYSNWTNIREEIHLNNKTNFFSEIVDWIKRTYKHFTYAHIGHSCIFFSENGNVLTESNLSSSVLRNQEKKQCIKDLFK